MSKDHMNINDLTALIAKKPELDLKFYFDEIAINPGYHVTEVRHATINSRDCGKNSGTEQWDEIIVQLLDGSPTSTQGHMSGSKFLGIIGSALSSLSTDTAAHLYFEFAPGNGPIRKLSIDSFERHDSELSVSLGSERAVCKPFQRAKDALAINGGNTQPSSGGCCSGTASSESSSCCG